MVQVILHPENSEALARVRQLLGDRHPLHPNIPVWWVEFDSLQLAEIAVLNLNLITGVRATLCEKSVVDNLKDL
jgi:hypothetical protein